MLLEAVGVVYRLENDGVVGVGAAVAVAVVVADDGSALSSAAGVTADEYMDEEGVVALEAENMDEGVVSTLGVGALCIDGVVAMGVDDADAVASGDEVGVSPLLRPAALRLASRICQCTTERDPINNQSTKAREP